MLRTRINPRPLLKEHDQTRQRNPFKVILTPKDIAILRKLPPPHAIADISAQFREALIENGLFELVVRFDLQVLDLYQIVVFRKVSEIGECLERFCIFTFVDEETGREGHEEEPNAEDYCWETLNYHG